MLTTKGKTMKTFILLVLVTILAGCGGGGSGGGTSSSVPTIGDGTGPGGNPVEDDIASPTYFGFNTQHNSILSEATTFIGETFEIPNEVAFSISDQNNRFMDAMIFQPSCIQGILEHRFNAVLLKGSSTSPSRVKITVSRSSVTITELTELQSGAGFVEKTTESNTGVCTDGEFYSEVSLWTLFQNGRTVLFKNMDGEIYFGMRDTAILTDKSLLYPRRYKTYHQIESGAVDVSSRLSVWSQPSASDLSIDVSGSATDSSFTFSNPNTLVRGFASNNRNSVFSLQNGFSTIWNQQANVLPMVGITAVLGGKVLSIQNGIHSNCQSGDVYMLNGNQAVCDMQGSGAISIYMEN